MFMHMVSCKSSQEIPEERKRKITMRKYGHLNTEELENLCDDKYDDIKEIKKVITEFDSLIDAMDNMAQVNEVYLYTVKDLRNKHLKQLEEWQEIVRELESELGW